jgi:hypothetical protein
LSCPPCPIGDVGFIYSTSDNSGNRPSKTQYKDRSKCGS